jgi:hypothetical protein
MTSHLHNDGLSDSDHHWRNEISLESERGGTVGVLAGVGSAVLAARDLAHAKRHGEKLIAAAGDVARRKPMGMMLAAFGAGCLAGILLMRRS